MKAGTHGRSSGRYEVWIDDWASNSGMQRRQEPTWSYWFGYDDHFRYPGAGRLSRRRQDGLDSIFHELEVRKACEMDYHNLRLWRGISYHSHDPSHLWRRPWPVVGSEGGTLAAAMEVERIHLLCFDFLQPTA